jgi:predicted DNA-binding transcriptional regulator AlpA
MKPQTKQLVLLALQGDETVSKEVADAVAALLAGDLPPKGDVNLKLLTMSAAARKLGLSRTWFWAKVKEEGGSKGASFPPIEIAPGVFRFRLRDIEAFTERNSAYVPKQRAHHTVCQN